MGGPVVDGGARPPKPEPMPALRLRSLIPEPVAFEIDFSVWEEHDRWQNTVPADLSELKGSA